MNIRPSKDGTVGVWTYRLILRVLRQLYRLKRKVLRTKPEWQSKLGSLPDSVDLLGTLIVYLSVYFAPHHFFRRIRRNGAGGAWPIRSPLTIILHTAALFGLIVAALPDKGILDKFSQLPLVGDQAPKIGLALMVAAAVAFLAIIAPVICLLYDLIYPIFLLGAGCLCVWLGSVLLDHLAYGDWLVSAEVALLMLASCLVVWKLHRNESLRSWVLLLTARIDWRRYFWSAAYGVSALSFALAFIAAALSFLFGLGLLLLLWFALLGPIKDRWAIGELTSLSSASLIACAFIARFSLHVYTGLLEGSVLHPGEKTCALYCSGINSRAAYKEVVDDSLSRLSTVGESQRAEAARSEDELRGYVKSVVREGQRIEYRLRNAPDMLERYRVARVRGFSRLWNLPTLLNRPEDQELQKHLLRLRFGSRLRATNTAAGGAGCAAEPIADYQAGNMHPPLIWGVSDNERARFKIRASALRRWRATWRASAKVFLVLFGLFVVVWVAYLSRRKSFILARVHEEASRCADDPNGCTDLGWITVLARSGHQREASAGALALNDKSRTRALLVALGSGVSVPSRDLAESIPHAPQGERSADAFLAILHFPSMPLDGILETIPVAERIPLLRSLGESGIHVPDDMFASVPDQVLSDLEAHEGPDVPEEKRNTIDDVDQSLRQLEEISSQLRAMHKPKLEGRALGDAYSCWKLMSGYSMQQLDHAKDVHVPEQEWERLWEKEVHRFSKRRPLDNLSKKRTLDDLVTRDTIERLFHDLPPRQEIHPALALASSRDVPCSERFQTHLALVQSLAILRRGKDALQVIRLAVNDNKCAMAWPDLYDPYSDVQYTFQELSRTVAEPELDALARRLPGGFRERALTGIELGKEQPSSEAVTTDQLTPLVFPEAAPPSLPPPVVDLVRECKYSDAWKVAERNGTSEAIKWQIYSALVQCR